MTHRFKEAGCDYLEFSATLNRDGILIIPVSQRKLVGRICRQFGLSVKNITGDYQRTTYQLDQELDEDKASKIQTWVKTLTS